MNKLHNMGARQSKRSVDISAGATKAEKVAAGEPLENGTITTASADEKQVVEANGGVEETTKQNGSTPHIDEKVWLCIILFYTNFYKKKYIYYSIFNILLKIFNMIL